MPTDRELDDLIDAALPSYSAAEPRPGLEHRILSHTLAEPQPKRSLIWAWALAIPAIACLLIFFILPGHRSVPRRTSPTVEVSDANTTPPTEARSNATTLAPTRRSALHLRSVQTSQPAAQETLPKEEIFPSPSPLTAEERAAIALVRDPVKMRREIDTARVEISPIHIAELRIKPIAPPDDLSRSLATESSPKAQQP